MLPMEQPIKGVAGNRRRWRMKRIIVLLAVVVALMVAIALPGLALADATPNDSNCNGQFFSDRSPETQSGGQQGVRAKEQALSGIRGDVLRDNTSSRANCGDNEVPQ